MNSDEPFIRATQAWLTSIIIAHNICPFAKREQERGSIRFSVEQQTDIETCLMNLMQECQRLDNDTGIETTLLIYAHAFKSFDDYLDFLAIAEDLLIDQGYEGIYQLASFHPDYYFEGARLDDPENYTNRSPYPMIHLLRETSIDRAVSSYPDVENIPQRNIDLTRTLGLAKLRDLLAACMKP
ncbi:MAG: hypothetical protein CG439_769 [Methylococcaceae bacterium NSP1-2]|nr:DUF1415 domain-containing protein [Methylococcaceae bacterium]OYV19718.1 MAG: hypothetical protein CG439_769 [Methylococcaceae bacterium NSP1-2]